MRSTFMLEQRYRQLTGGQTDEHGGLIYESPGMHKDIAKTLLARARSGDEALPSALPSAPALSFYEIKPELYGLPCRRPPYEGADQREPGRIVHSLVLPDADLDTISWLPIALLRASFWHIGPFSEERSFADVMKVANSPLPAPHATREFVLSSSEGALLLAFLLQALIDRQKTRKNVILVGDEDAVAHWIEALCLALPLVVRRQITFSTCEPEPEECYHCSVIGVRPKARARWSELSDRFHVIDLNSPIFEPVAADCLGARIGRAFCEDDSEWMAALDRMAARLLIRTFRDLERLMETRGDMLEARQPVTEAAAPVSGNNLASRVRSTGESGMDAVWDDIANDALALAQTGDMSVWLALADWSHDYSPAYLSHRLIDTIKTAGPDHLQAIGAILDCLATTKTGPLTTFFEACIALLTRSLQVRPSLWADDMRRCADVLLRSRDEHNLMPLLLDPLKENPAALMPTLRHILSANRSLSYLAASQFFNSRTLLKPEILNVNLREPALFGFFEEIFENAHKSGRLASLTRDFMDSIDRKRHPRDARHALGLALTCLQRSSASQSEYQELLACIPEIAEYPDQHGRYLLAVLSDSPIMVLPSNVDFQALWNSLNAQAAGTMTSVRPILTYKLTKAHNVCTSGGGQGWHEARATLRVTNLNIPQDDYRSYVSQVLRLLIATKEPLVEDSSLVDTFGIESLLPLFVDEYCAYLESYRGKTDLYGSAASVVVALGERFHFSPATQDLAARIIRHVGGDCGDEMHKMFRKRYESNPKGMAWWKGVDRSSGRSLLGKILNR